ncbi:carbohydrate binding domain-containing protein [Patescibacteria group bacterium]|nr:carbohydrate binding domain-containing protein [Patescibacteria group bacterium]
MMLIVQLIPFAPVYSYSVPAKVGSSVEPYTNVASSAIPVSEPVSVSIKDTGAQDFTFKKTKSTSNKVTVNRVDLYEESEKNIPLKQQKNTSNFIIEYYDEIGDYPIDSALYYISQSQNDDGSFGDVNTFKYTTEVMDMLAALGRGDNLQYQDALTYVLNTEPKDNIDIARKARIQKEHGQQEEVYLGTLALLDDDINADGGYGFKENHASDIMTSLEVFNASMRIGTINTKVFQYVDNQIPSSGNFSGTTFGSVPTYTDLVQAIMLLKPFKDLIVQYTYTSGEERQVAIQEKINILLAELQNRYSEQEGFMSGNPSLLDLAQIIYVFEEMGVLPDVLDEWRLYIEQAQRFDGSILGKSWETLYACYALRQTDLIVRNIGTLGDVQTRGEMSITFELKNYGFKTIDDAHIRFFFDGYNPNYTFSFTDQDFVMPPGSVAQVEIALSAQQTGMFLGDTKVQLFADVAYDRNYDNNWVSQVIHFVANTNGEPALPLYSVAYKSDVDIDGLVTAQFIWEEREDANRGGYVLLYRTPGATDWGYIVLGQDVVDSAALKGFPEDSTYELAVSVHDGSSIYLPVTYDTVTLSTDDSLYKGGMSGQILIDGEYPSDIQIGGYIYGTTSQEDGQYSISNLPNGGNIATVFTPEYEPIYTKYQIESNNITENVLLYSHLKEDAIRPEVNSIDISLIDGQVYTNTSVNIDITGSDNIAIDYFDLYYFDPIESYWAYMGSQDAETNTTTFSWYVSESIVGSGYKIKAHAVDYRGNISESLESVVFDIVNQPLGSVQGINVESVNNGVLVTWNSTVIPNNFVGYNVYKSPSEVDITTLEPIATVFDAQRDYFRDVTEGSQGYYYTVIFLNDEGEESAEYTWVGPVIPGAKIINIVGDGDMEQEENTWRRWGMPISWDKTIDDSYSGVYSTYLNAQEGHAGIQQLDIPVEAGKSYIFSFRYKHDAGEVYPILGIQNSNGDFEQRRDVLTSTGDSWGYYERKFIVPSDFVEDFRVRISVLYGQVHIDDIVITEVESLPIIRDGDFELDTLDSWKGWGGNTNWKKVTSTVSSGIQALQIGSADRVGGGVTQNYIPFELGHNYDCSFDYNVVNGVLYNTIGDSSANRDIEGLSIYFRNTQGEWRTYHRTISGDVFQTANSIMRFSTRNGMAYIDNVSCTVIDEQYLIFDANMEENGLASWENYANSLTIEKVTDDIHEGEQALHVVTEFSDSYILGGIQYRNISVEAGKTYTVSFFYKTNGSIVPRLGINTSNDDFELSEMNIPELQANAEWQEYSRTFTVPEDFDGDFRFVLRLQNWYIDGTEQIEYEGQFYEAPHHEFVGNGEMWIDNVDLVEVL